MRYFFHPVADATIYENATTRNTGFDEILEVGKENSGSVSVRSLIKFDIAQITSILPSVIPHSASFDLVLYHARADRLQNNQVVSVYPASQSWEEGSGYFYQDIYQEVDGVTWKHRYSGSLWNVTGSDYISSPTTGSILSQLPDKVTIDVSSIVREWISGSFSNNGFLMKFPDSDEDSYTNKGLVKFFSRNTHTIYIPTLVAKWDDATYTTGALGATPEIGDLFVGATLDSEYTVNEIGRVDITVRERYPLKTASTMFTQYAGVKYLPTSSYFSIIDLRTGDTVIPFSNESKISCNVSGSYFYFQAANMYPQRYYAVKIRVDRNGKSEYFSPKEYFKVVL